MTAETDLWALVLKCITAILVTLVVTVGGCTTIANQLIGTATDPLAVSCAIGNNTMACVAVGKKSQESFE
jgi:hypothetical protein